MADTQTPEVPPIPQGLGDIDVASLMAKSDTINNSLDSSMSSLVSALNIGTQGAQTSQQGYQQEAEAQQTINTATMQAALKEKADDAKTAAMWGTNHSASSFVLAGLSDDITNMEGELNKRGKAITDKSSVSILDNPIDWFTNQLTLPADIAGYNSIASRLNASQDQAAELAARTQEGFKINAVLDANASTQLLDGQNRLALAKSVIAVGQSQQDLAKLGITGVDVSSKLSEEKFQNAVAIQSAQAEQQNLKINAVRTSFEALQAKATADYRDIMVAQKEDQDASNRDLQKKLDTVTATYGMNRISALEFRQMPNSQYKQMLESAVQDPAALNGLLGVNTAEALVKANALNLPLTPGQNLVRKNLIAIQTAAEQDPLYPKGRDLQEQAAFVQKAIETSVRAEANNIPAEGGIYSPPPLRTLLANPNVIDMGISKPLADIANKNPLLPTRADDVFATGVAQVVSGKESPEQVAMEINKLYDTSNILNTNAKGYNRWVLPTPTTFKTAVNPGIGWGTTRSVDMTDYGQVYNLLTRALISQNMNTYLNTAG